MEDTIESLRKEITKINERNRRVELDKTWEVSWQRKVAVALFTYLPISIYMYYIQVADPWLNAIVPTLGFLISTLTLPWLKREFDRSQK